MGKIYFGIQKMLVNIKSIFITLFFKFYGGKIGKNNKFYKKQTIIEYLNKIIIGDNCYFDDRVRVIVNKEGSLKIGNNTLLSSNVSINAGKGNVDIGYNIIVAAYTYIINSDHCIDENLSVR